MRSRVQTPLKSWIFEASKHNYKNCVHNSEDHSLFWKRFFPIGIGISLQCECRGGGFYPSHSVLIKQLGSVQCITLLQKQQHFQMIIMLQWHFSCLLFVGFAYSSDFKLLQSSWRNTTASCADLLQHLSCQSQPYQPDNGKSYSEPDDKCYLPKNGSTSCKYSVLYYPVCVCSLPLAWTLWYTTPNHVK